ncbi:MAG: PTS fructose transporter subunit IID [Lactococcus sp.]|jgi:mannose/fructose/N-acetylgalactosamine-specific phosphotransferase system component IID
MERLNKKELRQIWYRWVSTSLSSMSYEKLEAHAMAYSFIPFVKKYYENDPEAMTRLLVRHSMFYNTEPQTGSLVTGIVTSLEEEIAIGNDVPEDLPITIKTSLMGPVAGIGDSIMQGIIIPILLSIAMGLATGGNALGPIFYIIAYAIIGPLVSYTCFMQGHKLGISAIDVIVGENVKRITDAINVLGIMVVGGLAASNVALSLKVKIPHGEKERVLLQDTFDAVFPKALPLLIVILAWYLLTKKHLSATKVILILTAITAVGVLIGLF